MNILTLPLRSASDLDHVTVLVIAADTRFADLTRYLPQDWTVLRRTTPEPVVRDPDIVVLDDPGPRAVTAACLRHPTSAIVVVLSPYSDHQEVVDVLEAGADACVRSNTTAVVAAHVEACRRRQAA
ncbi:response regulator transcription factor [Dactylosporangium aurantiacum]|uniref:Response regulator transcription factor n=1 Tax=Dactylosporangium aurantiacum TaxID=35754 RepID=A0A9Q9MHE0_9ACTN|nr:response regulator transcription factor [Dactylosporangium aurantiacum]MDG6104363.1 response regulator transcription factor [Dactylosporangium aurantiacum]UWZ56649.1 response regulator transcription factor [Dactylosporangium aurantiacum]